MDCERIRVALSAMIDEEALGVPPERVRAHLAGCDDCRAWLEHAHEVTRRLRLTAAMPVPNLTDSIVAGTAVRAGRRRPALLWVRAALVGVAAGQLALTVPPLLFGHDRSAPTHVAHELGSFGLALAVGFVAAAARPARARGMLPLLGVVALCLCGTAAADLAGGGTDAGDEVPHLLAVAGWLLVWLLAVLFGDRLPGSGQQLRMRRRRRPAQRGRPTGTGAVANPSVQTGRRVAA